MCLHRARAASLGLRVRLRDPRHGRRRRLDERGAYGGDIAGVLQRALIADASGLSWRTPEELGLQYRRSAPVRVRVVVSAEFRLRPRPVDEIRAMVAEMQAVRKAAQPTNKRTFGTSRTPSTSCRPDGCSRPAVFVGTGYGAQISPRHANFIENADGARSLDAIEPATEARRRALDGVRRRARASRFSCSGRSGSRPRANGCRSDPAAAKLAPWRTYLRPLPSGRSCPAARSRLVSASPPPSASSSGRARRPSSPFTRCRSISSWWAVPPGRQALEGLDGTSLLRIDQEEIQRRFLDKLLHVHLLGYDRAFPNTLRVKVSVEWPVAVVRRGGRELARFSEGAGSSAT